MLHKPRLLWRFLENFTGQEVAGEHEHNDARRYFLTNQNAAGRSRFSQLFSTRHEWEARRSDPKSYPIDRWLFTPWREWINAPWRAWWALGGLRRVWFSCPHEKVSLLPAWSAILRKNNQRVDCETWSTKAFCAVGDETSICRRWAAEVALPSHLYAKYHPSLLETTLLHANVIGKSLLKVERRTERALAERALTPVDLAEHCGLEQDRAFQQLNNALDSSVSLSDPREGYYISLFTYPNDNHCSSILLQCSEDTMDDSVLERPYEPLVFLSHSFKRSA